MDHHKKCPLCKADTYIFNELDFYHYPCGHSYICVLCLKNKSNATLKCNTCGLQFSTENLVKNVYDNFEVDKDIYIRKKLYDIYCAKIKRLETYAENNNDYEELDNYLEEFEEKIDELKKNFLEVDREIHKIKKKEKSENIYYRNKNKSSSQTIQIEGNKKSKINKSSINIETQEKSLEKVKKEKSLSKVDEYMKIIIGSTEITAENYYNVEYIRKALESLDRNDI